MPQADEAKALAAVFGKAPKEAVKFLANKRNTPSDGWERVSAAAHQHAFTVAQTAGFEVISDIKAAIENARDKGWSHKQFQAQLGPLLRAKGWWGKAIDPATGEITKTYPNSSKPVMYGSPARLKLIYDTNLTSSYAAGRRERQLAVVKTFPYWRYLAVMDGRTRASHKKLHNTIYPADHPFWQVNYPPNGFRCRCTVQALRQADVDKAGLQVQDGGDFIERQVTVNANRDVLTVRGFKAKDGREFWPDAGFDVAPGRLQNALNRLGQSLAKLPESSLPIAARVMTKGDAFVQWRKNPEGNFPIGLLSAAAAAKIGQRKGSRIVNLSAQTMQKQERHHPEISDAEYALVQQSISIGEMVQDGQSSLIFIWSENADEGAGQVVVVKATQSGQAIFLTSLRRLSRDAVKRDAEVQRILAMRKRSRR